VYDGRDEPREQYDRDQTDDDAGGDPSTTTALSGGQPALLLTLPLGTRQLTASPFLTDHITSERPCARENRGAV
jgi:hypothetical protein